MRSQRMTTAGSRFQAAAMALTVALTAVGCTSDDAEARSIARETCDAVENADANPPRYMLQGFKDAEASGVAESQFRDALVEECGMEPPSRSTLEQINEEES